MRKLNTDKLHKFVPITNIFRGIKYIRLGWAGYVDRMEDRIIGYSFL